MSSRLIAEGAGESQGERMKRASYLIAFDMAGFYDHLYHLILNITG